MRDPLVIGVPQPGSPALANRGYSGPLQQWYESSFDATSGFTNRVGYEGLDWVQAQSLANYFTARGISATLRNEHGASTLTITDATGNFVIDKWELSVDKEQPEMFGNPLFLNLINGAALPSKVVTIMKSALKNASDPSGGDAGWYALVQSYQAVVDTSDPTTGLPLTYKPATINTTAVQFLIALGIGFTGVYPGNNGTTGATNEWASANMILLKQYFDMYNLGVTNYLSGKYRLRHTSNIPAQWNVSAADFNVERIYTIAQLISECTGSGFIYPLPNYLAYKILNFVPDVVAGWTPYYVWGALKEKSDAQTAVNSRVDIVTEYLIDNINTGLYFPI